MTPTILFENDAVLVLDKPSGLLVHSDGKSEGPTLVDWLRAQYPALEGVGESMRLQSGEEISRPGIVHRLDRETSGVMVVAKTPVSYAFLKKQFQGRETEKIYHAFAWGIFKEESGVIDRPIGRSPSDPRKRIATRGAKGVLREAVTEYVVLERGSEIALVEARPKTGRTHQIRTHFLAIHHPLVGDTLYGPRRGTALGFSRTALHAKSISFTLPNDESCTVEAPYPEDFIEGLKQLHGERAQ